MWVNIPVPWILWEKTTFVNIPFPSSLSSWVVVVSFQGGTTTPRVGSGTREATCHETQLLGIPNSEIKLGGGNSNILYFHPVFGEDEPNLTNIFQMGWNHQLVKLAAQTKQLLGCPRKLGSKVSHWQPWLIELFQMTWTNFALCNVRKSFVTTLLGQPFVIGAGLCIVYQVCSNSFEYCTGFWKTLSRKRMQRRGSTMLPGTTSWTSSSYGCWLQILVLCRGWDLMTCFHVLFVTTLMDWFFVGWQCWHIVGVFSYLRRL